MNTLALSLGRILLPNLVNRLTRGRGETLQKVAEAAMEATGLAPDADEDAVRAALAANPEAYVELQRIAAEQAIAELEADTAARQLAASDRADARRMHETMQGKAVARLVWAAIIFAVATFGTLVGLIVAGVQIENGMMALLGTAVGAASARLDQVFNFFLGSSQGSKEKTAMMAGVDAAS